MYKKASFYSCELSFYTDVNNVLPTRSLFLRVPLMVYRDSVPINHSNYSNRINFLQASQHLGCLMEAIPAPFASTLLLYLVQFGTKISDYESIEYVFAILRNYFYKRSVPRKNIIIVLKLN